MSASTFTTEIQSINVFKFGYADFSLGAIPDKINSIDIKPQVHELTIYESLRSPILRCEMAVLDAIGLFTKFPLTGEEIIILSYKNIADNLTKRLVFVIDEISHINVSDDNKALAYAIKCVSIEAFANGLGNIQQAYEGDIPTIARMVYQEHISKPLTDLFSGFTPKPLSIENNETLASTIVIPNVRPFAAIDMLSKIAVPEVDDRYTYLFYQTVDGFEFCTIQGLIDRPNARRNARLNPYRYFSDEINERGSQLNNEGRVISYVNVTKRHSSLQKLIQGYYHNNRVEINMAQKAFWSERTEARDTITISPHLLNTSRYIEATGVKIDDEEISNRTKYVLTNQREHDSSFPVSRMRSRWGKDLVTNIALGQIDVIVTIPGTNKFHVGDLFYFEYPEIDGFENSSTDDLISGFFIISELKHIITNNGLHSVVLSLSKDSYNSSPDRRSQYG